MKIDDLYSPNKLYYIASPFTAETDYKEYLRYQEVTKIAAQLVHEYNLHLICPITTSYQLKLEEPKLGTKWESWAETDELLLTRCDGIIVVKIAGWDKSVGVAEEIKIAKRKGMPIYYLEYTLKNDRPYDGASTFDFKLTKSNYRAKLNYKGVF